MRAAYGQLARERRSERAERITYTLMMAALFMLGMLAIWRSMAPTTMTFPAEAPTLYVTTTVGPPLTGHGHPAHPRTP